MAIFSLLTSKIFPHKFIINYHYYLLCLIDIYLSYVFPASMAHRTGKKTDMMCQIKYIGIILLLLFNIVHLVTIIHINII